MSGILPIHSAHARKQIAQDAPATIFSRGVATPVSPFFRVRACAETIFAMPRDWRISRDGRRCGRCRPCGRTERVHKGLGKLHKPQFSTAPTPIIFFSEKREETTKNAASVPIWLSQQRGSPQVIVPRIVP